MKLFRGNDGEQDETGNATETRLERTFKEDANADPEGVLYEIHQTMQELQLRVDSRGAGSSSDDEDDSFRAASELPASCAVEQEGHMFTAAEVNDALRRTETNAGAGEEHERNCSETMAQTGLRSRIRRRKKPKKRNSNLSKEKRKSVVGIFGTSTTPSKWSLTNYLQSVASTREKRIVAVSAWLLALIGLIVSLVFVTKDFLESRREMASTVRYVDSTRLELPSIWLCTPDSEFPPFMNLPDDKYRGQPLLWLDFLRGTSNNINVSFPQTRALQQVGVASYDMSGNPCKAAEAMDPDTFYKENSVKPACFHCFTIIRSPPFAIDKSAQSRDAVNTSEHAALRVAYHSFISKCRSSQYGLNRVVLQFFIQEVKNNHEELRRRGVLDFGSYDPSISTSDPYLWPLYRLGFRNSTVDFVVYDVVDMFCNVYMFSGVFYPSTAKDVKFKFNDRVFRWERVGKGPYYPSNFTEYYQHAGNLHLFTSSPRIGQEDFEDRATYLSETLQVMTNYSRIGGTETLAVLRPNQIAHIGLSRNMIHKRESFQSRVIRNIVLPGDVRTVNNVYFLDIGFTSFLTRVVSDQQSVSWSAFSADFFGLTSLFLDVSVYTLIVAPLLVRAKRRAIAAKKRRLAAHTT